MTLLSRLCAGLALVMAFAGSANAAVQGIFAHYMVAIKHQLLKTRQLAKPLKVGGMSSISQALADVSQAQALGLDAFALNVQQPDADWSRASLSLLFDAASQIGFKLFFSMDMAIIASPSACLPLLTQYVSHPAYYHYQSRPFLSTFRGGASPSASNDWQTALQTLNPAPFFVPNFEDHPSVTGGIFPASIFNTFPNLSGLMGWETAWPFQGAPTPADSTSAASSDATNLARVHAANKVYMMPLSSFQSKHHRYYGNWFRRGGLLLAQRMQAVMDLQPDFVELLTWNDAGEGHYFGNVWPEALGGEEEITAEIDGFDHRGWQAVIRPWISAVKAGVRVGGGVVPVAGRAFAGTFWYRPLLKGADCSGDRFGLAKPSGWEDAEDTVSVVVMLGRDSQGVRIRVWGGGNVLGEFDGKPGMNVYQVEARTGEQAVQVVASDGTFMGEGIGSGWITNSIGDIGGICNFNYQAVEIV